MKQRLLKSLAALMLPFMGWQSVAAQTEPVADGTYYLYNVDQGQFLKRGNSWGTQGSLLSTGETVTLKSTELPSGAYKLATGSGSTYVFAEDGSSVWMDGNGDGTGGGSKKRCYNWDIEKQEDGTYLIRTSSEDEYVTTNLCLGGYTDEGLNNTCAYYLFSPTGHDAAAVRWIFLTEEEYNLVQTNVEASADTRRSLYKYIASAKAMGYTSDEITAYYNPATEKSVLVEALSALPSKLLAYAKENASEDNPMDVSFLISNANCGVAFTPWVATGSYSSNTSFHYNGDAYLSGCFFEIWKGGAGLDDNQISQALTNLPVGAYTLGADVNAVWQNDASQTVTGVSLFADAYAAQSTACSTGNGAPQYFSTTFITIDGAATIGIKNESTNANWLAFDNFKLYYNGTTVEVLKISLGQMLEKANAVDQNTLNSYLANRLTVAITAGNEAQNSDEKAVVESATDELISVMSAIETMVPEIASAKASIEEYEAISTNSKPMTDEAKATYDAAIVAAKTNLDAAKDVETLNSIVTELEAARQVYVLQAYPTNDTTFDVTFVAGTESSAWTNGGNAYTTTSDKVRMIERYFDDQYRTGDMMTQTITGLPMGIYEVELYANANWTPNRGSITEAAAEAGTEVSSVFANDVTQAVPLAHQTATATAGVYTLSDVLSTGSIKMGIRNDENGANWLLIQVKSIKLVRELTDEEKLTAAKTELQAGLDEANTMNTTANVGDGAFQIPASAVTIFNQAVEDAQSVYNSGNATADDVNEATVALTKAIEAYENVTLNVPEEDNTYNIVLSTTNSTWDYNGKAVTFISGGQTSDQGNYAIQFITEPGNPTYAQVYTFVAVDGQNNCYNIAFQDNDGETRYICDGSVTGASTGVYGIRTTTDKSKALAVKVAATATDGVHTLYNTVANQFLGSQDAGLYTVNSHIYFELRPVPANAEVTLNVTSAEWATLMLPFAAEIPEGLTVYSCAGTEDNGESLTLEQADAIEANTPYIVSGAAGSYDFSGRGLATKNAYEAGWLYGTYETVYAPASSYVLQNQDGKVGFYLVENAEEIAVKPNRAYMVSAASEVNVRALLLPTDDVTGIENVEAAGDAEVDVYSINGVLVRKAVKAGEALKGLQKGLYIVNGVKKAVK